MPRGVPKPVPKDTQLIQIVDAAFASAARRSGPYLVCRPGCTQCCHGPFPINQLDVARLRHGLAALAQSDPARADAIRQRARAAAALLEPNFPGDPTTGLLSDDEEAIARFEDLANDEVCPVLSDSHSKDGPGLCELYAFRPMTCRVFGPPIRAVHMSTEVHEPSVDGDTVALGHCELCYHGATPEEVAACELTPGTDALEAELNAAVEKRTGIRGETYIAFALR